MGICELVNTHSRSERLDWAAPEEVGGNVTIFEPDEPGRIAGRGGYVGDCGQASGGGGCGAAGIDGARLCAWNGRLRKRPAERAGRCECDAAVPERRDAAAEWAVRGDAGAAAGETG